MVRRGTQHRQPKLGVPETGWARGRSTREGLQGHEVIFIRYTDSSRSWITGNKGKGSLRVLRQHLIQNLGGSRGKASRGNSLSSFTILAVLYGLSDLPCITPVSQILRGMLRLLVSLRVFSILDQVE